MTFNSTVHGLGYNSTPPWFDALRITTLSIVVFFILSGNILCFFVIRSSRQMRKVSRIFLVSLIVADLCAGLFSSGSLLATVAAGHLVPAGMAEGLCKAYFMGGLLFNGGSIMSLLALICDCYIALEKPLQYPSLLTARRAYNITWSFWMLMLSVTLGYGVYFGTLQHHQPDWHWCLAETSPSKIEPYILILLLYATVKVVFPWAVTIVLYVRIRLIVHRHNTRLARITPPGHSSQNRSNDTKSLTTFLIVNCGAALTALPQSVLLVYSYWTGEFSLYGISAVMIIRSFSNLLNVLVHTRRNGEFRSTVARVLGLRNSRNARNDTGTASVASASLSCISPAIG